MKLSVALTVAALLASTAAMAQHEPGSPAGSYHAPPQSQAAQAPSAPQAGATANVAAIFDKLNTSHTGKLTREEAKAQPTVAGNFEAADTNKDGVLSKDEFLAAFSSQ
jgi:hypothetical protein